MMTKNTKTIASADETKYPYGIYPRTHPGMVTESEYGDNWIGNYVEPMLKKASKHIFEWLQSQAQEFEPDQEDGSKEYAGNKF